jgi:hypothetical protein
VALLVRCLAQTASMTRSERRRLRQRKETSGKREQEQKCGSEALRHFEVASIDHTKKFTQASISGVIPKRPRFYQRAESLP